MNKKLAPLRAKNDVTHAILLNCMNERTKSRFQLVVTSYGRNKYLDEIKNQKKANNSPRYRCAAIKKRQHPIKFKFFEV